MLQEQLNSSADRAQLHGLQSNRLLTHSFIFFSLQSLNIGVSVSADLRSAAGSQRQVEHHPAAPGPAEEQRYRFGLVRWHGLGSHDTMISRCPPGFQSSGLV